MKLEQTPLAINLCSYLAGRKIESDNMLPIRSPYDGRVVGHVALAARKDTNAAVAAALGFRDTPSRYQRAEVLEKTRVALEARREEFARTITSEAGLALREAR